MKFIFELEDVLIGIACGILLIGYTGRYFSLKLPGFAYVLAFAALIIFIILDVVNEISDLSTHFGLIMLSLLHSVVDFIISLTFISFFSGWNIPYITSMLVPYLQNESIIFYTGAFLVVTNAIWFILILFTL